VMFWVPQSCDIGIGLSILSFDGTVEFGVTTDAALVPDPDEIVQRFKSEFEAMLYSVLLEAPAHPEASPAQDQPASESLAKAESSRSVSSAASKELASA